MDTNEELVYRIQRAEAIGDYIQSKKLCGILYEKNKGLIFETTLSYKKIMQRTRRIRRSLTVLQNLHL